MRQDKSARQTKVGRSKKASKNISKKVRNGLILQTRDEYFEGKGDYRKPGYENKGNYRKAVVVDSNRNDELAVVKLTTKKGYKLNNKSRYRPYIEVKDDTHKAIKVGKKFVPTNKTIDTHKVKKIKRNCLRNPNKSIRDDNRNKLREFSRNKKQE